MILALLAVAVITQAPQLRDSASVARLLASLRTSDAAVCELAGRALTNFGGWWGSDDDLPMPMPMPIPMPFAGGGIEIHTPEIGPMWGGETDPKVLGAFRVALRDQSRCVRQIAARMVGRSRPAWASPSFTSMLTEAAPGLRETGLKGLGEIEDRRAVEWAIAQIGDRES